MVFIICACVGCSPTDSDESGNLALLEPALAWQEDELVVIAGVDWRPTEAVIEAMEHGVAVPLRITTRSFRRYGWLRILDRDRNHRYEVRYLPMLRSYQIADTKSDEQRNYPRLHMLVDSLRQPQPWATGLTRDDVASVTFQLEIRGQLDRTRLPSPMRMPVWFDPQWRAISSWQQWLLDDEVMDD